MTKQCADPSENGCGEVKPESEFKPRKYLSSAGNVSIKRDKRCRECVNRMNRKASRVGKPKLPIAHTGPARGTMWHKFLCRVPYPPMSKELREARCAG